MSKLREVIEEVRKVIDTSPAEASRIIAEAGKLDGDPGDLVLLGQLYARAINKDEDLLAPQKYELARDILETQCDPANSLDGETLGLAGSVYKRLWEYTGQRVHLEASLAWYRKGYEKTADPDGWLGVNTAFVLDLLGVEEGKLALDGAQRKAARFREADEVRRAVATRLANTATPGENASSWFFHASHAEAALGLGDFAAAAAALHEGKTAIAATAPRPLQQETTARQLATIARLRFDGTPQHAEALKIIETTFGISSIAARALGRGKIGLALSGGGFRASLFHIGVLAKLAELDLLRHVEVISCVSGGSIIGAFYYLELKKNLEAGKTSHADYIKLVEEVEKKFLEGVQQNLRTRIAASPFSGLRMMAYSGYSRSDVIGELYQKHFYDRTAAAGQAAPRVMSDLIVKPKELGSGTFNPKYDNWRLSAKVPILVLNATTLNTGHNWQFTATWMGESPQAISATIDAIPRYRRMYYADAPEAHQNIPIGRAVGASACVPALFEPIVLRNLFPDRTVRLVDGGVHDNQGLASVLEQNCRVILISDASGQMQEQKNPGGSIPSAFGSSNGILQARVREAQFDQLTALRRGGAAEAMFIHLTKDLDADPVSWIGEPDKPGPKRADTTTYGIDRVIQRRLSSIRTDLDSFTDAEAFALMTSGYRMAEESLVEDQCVPSLLPLNKARHPWRFLAVDDAMVLAPAASKETSRLRKLLVVSHKLPLKVWWQLRSLQLLAVAIVFGLAIAAGNEIKDNWRNPLPSVPLPSVGEVTVAVLAVLAFHFVLFGLARLRIYHKRVGEIAIGALVFGLWPLAWLHLLVFDRLFLKHGRWPPKPPQRSVAVQPSTTRLHPVDAPGSNVPPATILPELGPESTRRSAPQSAPTERTASSEDSTGRHSL